MFRGGNETCCWGCGNKPIQHTNGGANVEIDATTVIYSKISLHYMVAKILAIAVETRWLIRETDDDSVRFSPRFSVLLPKRTQSAPGTTQPIS